LPKKDWRPAALFERATQQQHFANHAPTNLHRLDLDMLIAGDP
jgi:hypothetical protein